MTSNKQKKNEVIYSLNASDIQSVAADILDRDLTDEEIDSLRDSIGDSIDWYQVIENAINKHIEL